MYVTELEVRDLRCISRTHLRFSHPGGAERLPLDNLNVLVGVNGGGKSTLLKGVLLAILGAELRSGPARSWGGWLRKGGRSDTLARASLLFHRDDLPGVEGMRSDDVLPTRRQFVIERATEASDAESPAVQAPSGRLASPTFFLAAYGASRELTPTPRAGPEDDPLEPVAHLLFGDAPLLAPEAWLTPAHPRFTEILELVNALLPVHTHLVGELEHGVHLFEHRGVRVPRHALSDGQQGYLAWMLDLVRRIVQRTYAGDDLRDIAGVVMVDELDQRMHPRWQQRVLGRLATVLPNLQFFLTTHSPLLVSGLHAQNLILLEPDPDAEGYGAMRARRLTEQIYGSTADQVLTSSYFDMETSRSQPFQAELRRLSLAARAGDDESALEHMRRLAGTGRASRATDDDETPPRRTLKPGPPEGDADDAAPTQETED